MKDLGYVQFPSTLKQYKLNFRLIVCELQVQYYLTLHFYKQHTVI